MKNTYAFQYNNQTILKNSSSGGAFTALSDYILSRDGILYGAIYDYDNNSVSHYRAKSHQERDLMRGSKYIQSQLHNTYCSICRDLENGLNVLFTGTICQVAGLYCYLHEKKIETSKLYTCDIICHGVSSPLMWKEYLKYKNVEHMDSISFRDKTYGWGKSQAIGKIQSQYIDFNQYMKLFYSHTIMRPACHECSFTNVDRISDITIGDFWGIETAFPEIDENMGVSFVMTNSDKGQGIFDEVIKNKAIVYKQCNLSDVVQPNLYHPTKKSVIRSRVWRDYRSKGMDYIINEYLSCSKTKRIKVTMKKVLDTVYYKINKIWRQK